MHSPTANSGLTSNSLVELTCKEIERFQNTRKPSERHELRRLSAHKKLFSGKKKFKRCKKDNLVLPNSLVGRDLQTRQRRARSGEPEAAVESRQSKRWGSDERCSWKLGKTSLEQNEGDEEKEEKKKKN